MLKKQLKFQVKRLLIRLKYIWGVAFFIGTAYILKFEGFSLPEPDRSILGNFIEWYGILLSVLLALLVVQVWSKYNMVGLLIDKEADAFASLLRFARFLEDSDFFHKLSKEVKHYCKEYSRYADPNNIADKAYREQQEKIYAILLTALQTKRKSHVSTEMIRIFDEAIDTRGDREAYLKEKVHGSLWFLLIVSSMIWLLSFVWLSFQNINLYLGAFMTLFTTFTIVGLLVIARDIDNPVGGMWKISYASFDETCGEIEYMEEKVKHREKRL